MYGPSMCSPAMPAASLEAIVLAHAANTSSDDEINVGRNDVTPVACIAMAARPTSAGVVAGSLKSTPAKPLTCRSHSPADVRRLPAMAPQEYHSRPGPTFNRGPWCANGTVI